MIEIYEGLIFLTLILAIVTVFLTIKSWLFWNNNDENTIKARVFLDKTFLIQNFRLTIVSVLILIVIIGIHILMEYIELTGKVSFDFYIVYYGVFPVAMLSLTLVMYKWYKILYKNGIIKK